MALWTNAPKPITRLLHWWAARMHPNPYAMHHSIWDIYCNQRTPVTLVGGTVPEASERTTALRWFRPE